VGSGTVAACGGRHFSGLAPRGESQEDGSCLKGMQKTWASVVQFKPRDGVSGAVDLKEESVFERVRADLRRVGAEATVAVVHCVCGSKTGLAYPSLEGVIALREEFGQRLLIVVDACQLRCELRHIKRYSELGCVTLITGSKFFAGPPFAGKNSKTLYPYYSITLYPYNTITL
jgi:hypothetical protein